jgi:hypothetical protein
MKPLKKCVILSKMDKIEGPNTGSFVKKAYSTRMHGMMILIMMPLLLMMLLPWQQNYMLPHGPHHTSHLSSPCMMDTQIQSSSDELRAIISSYGGNTAVMANSFVMAVRNVAQTWYSSLRPGTITSW